MGEQKTSAPDGTLMSTSVLFLEKTVTQAESRMSERVVEVDPDKKVKDFTVYMNVSGSKFTLEDSTHVVTGAGNLFGTPWDWSYFKGTWTVTSNGTKIEDEDFMSDPTVLVSRKRIYKADGTLVMFADASLHKISETTFKLLAASLLRGKL